MSFAPRTRRWLIGVGAASLLALVAQLVLGDRVEAVRSFGADSFSYSALGHRGFVEWLRAMDVPVHVSRGDPAAHAGVVAFLEPDGSAEPEEGADPLGAVLGRAERILVVLPKWDGEVRHVRVYGGTRESGWVAVVTHEPESAVLEVLEQLSIDADVVRLDAPAPAADWTLEEGLSGAPTLALPQFIETSDLEPLVINGSMLLAGTCEREGTQVVVVSDPDLLSNHGLGHGENAALVLSLLAPGEDHVVVDETLHGYARPPTFGSVVLRFPFSLAMIHLALAVGLCIWAGALRFGPVRATEAAVDAGKDALLENTADLLLLGGHSGYVLERYLATNAAAVSTELRIGGEANEIERRSRLAEVGAQRGGSVDFARLNEDVAALSPRSIGRAGRVRLTHVVAVARRIHTWRREMMHGPRGRADDS